MLIVSVGTGLFALAFVVLLPFHATLSQHGTAAGPGSRWPAPCSGYSASGTAGGAEPG